MSQDRPGASDGRQGTQREGPGAAGGAADRAVPVPEGAAGTAPVPPAASSLGDEGDDSAAGRAVTLRQQRAQAAALRALAGRGIARVPTTEPVASAGTSIARASQSPATAPLRGSLAARAAQAAPLPIPLSPELEAFKTRVMEAVPGLEADAATVGLPAFRVERERLLAVAAKLRELPAANLDYLTCLSGVDYPKHVELVYHLFSIEARVGLVLKVSAPKPIVAVASAAATEGRVPAQVPEGGSAAPTSADQQFGAAGGPVAALAEDAAGESVPADGHMVNLVDVVDRVSAGYPPPEPAVPSVTVVWPGANWHEREVFDLLGVYFVGHPDLRRILMPEGFSGGYPLRKDYVDHRPQRSRTFRAR